MEWPTAPEITRYCSFESLGWTGFIDIEGMRSISPVFEEDNKLFITVTYESGDPVKLYAKSLENANDLAKHIYTHMREYRTAWERYSALVNEYRYTALRKY